jgi:hypothetical protein
MNVLFQESKGCDSMNWRFSTFGRRFMKKNGNLFNRFRSEIQLCGEANHARQVTVLFCDIDGK